MMSEWIEVDPEDLCEHALPAHEPEPEPEPLILPVKQKRCVVCQNYLLVRPTEFSDVTVGFEYHQRGVLGAPCAKHFGWPEVTALGPHLCKRCIACGHTWPEALPEPEEDNDAGIRGGAAS